MTNPPDLPKFTPSSRASSGEALRNELVQGEVEPMASEVSRQHQVLCFIALARPRHYGKNILVIAGILLAVAHQPVAITPQLPFTIVCGLVATCLVASSNYVLNGILDAASDRFHPSKRDRPVASGRVSVGLAYVQWLVLGGLGLSFAYSVGWLFFSIATLMEFMAIVYNVPPVRLKDLPYLDVLSEALNSPIRLMLGWTLVLPSEIPDFRLILAFWMAGAFAMAWKRLRELRLFRDRTVAAAYRNSFAHYNQDRLKMYMAMYALGAAAFLLAW